MPLPDVPTLIPSFCWTDIDIVFLDLDGTLLDKYFDDYFWEHFVPKIYAGQNGVSLDEARQILLATYQSVENTLAWTDLDYWSTRLGLDIMQLKKDVDHLISIRPGVIDFLSFLKKMRKKIYLLSNAHPKTVAVKLTQFPLEPWFDDQILADEIGYAKEQPQFWPALQNRLPFDKRRTLFIDDTEKVLESAAGYGIKHLVHIALPSSCQPIRYSIRFPSITEFLELQSLTPG